MNDNKFKENSNNIAIYTQNNNIPLKKSHDEFEDLEEMKILNILNILNFFFILTSIKFLY